MLKTLKRVGLVLLPLLFIAAGCWHFLCPKTFLRIMPDLLPFKRALVLLSGIVEVFAGFGYLFPRWRRSCRNVLVLLLIAVFPANINMAVKDIDFGFIPHWILWLRLPLQLLLIWLVVALAKPEKADVSSR